MRKFILIVTLAVATVAGAQNPFVGTWKLDPAKGHYTGYSFSNTEISAGHFLHKEGSTSYEFGTDGKDYPMELRNATVSYQQTGPNQWHRTFKLDGKVTGQSDVTLSEDGKTMNATGTNTAEDGTTSQFTFKNERVSGGPGLAGNWKRVNTKFDSDSILVISEPSKNSMTLDIKQDKQVLSGPTDGHTPWTITSLHPDADKHFGVTALRSGPRNLTYSSLLDGKETGKGEMTVSEDGKTLTDTQWDVTKPNEKTIDVYERQ